MFAYTASLSSAEVGYAWLGNDIARSNYDTAYLCWHGEWRMPTIQEAEELGKKCTWTWTSVNGINGYKVMEL